MKQLTLLLLAVLVLKGHAEALPSENLERQSTTNTSAPAPSAIPPSQTSQARLEALAVLIKRAQYQQAYSLAERMVEEFEGDEKFDFQYGMAAVETQHYDPALFAFERLVLIYPNQPRYRLELARTHFYLRNLVRAEVEFNKVLQQNPPAAVRKNVELFLDKISELQRTVEPRFMFAIDIGAGYDSNINSATSEQELPKAELVFPWDIPLDATSQETASAYWSTLLNMSYISPISKTSAFDIRGVYSKRSNSEIELYDLDTAMAEAGYAFYTGPVRWRAGGRYQYVQLNTEELLNTVSFIGQSNWILKSGASYGLAMNYGQSTYPANSDGDMTVSQYTLSFNSAPNKNSWSLALLFGQDEAESATNEFNGKAYQGFTFQSTTLWGQRASRYWMLNVISSEYEAINSALYTKLRKDTALNYGVGWRYAFNSHFSIRNDYSLGYTDSSLEANTYKRAKAEFGLTYSF